MKAAQNVHTRNVHHVDRVLSDGTPQVACSVIAQETDWQATSEPVTCRMCLRILVQRSRRKVRVGTGWPKVGA